MGTNLSQNPIDCVGASKRVLIMRDLTASTPHHGEKCSVRLADGARLADNHTATQPVCYTTPQATVTQGIVA